MDKIEIYKLLYERMIKGGRLARWRGRVTLKFPSDLMLYQEAIFKNRPDVIIETGTRFGGSALFYADMCELNGHGEVITVDIKNAALNLEHPRITRFIGSSIDDVIWNTIKEKCRDKKCMVVLDSNHRFHHVVRELSRYSQLVPKGQYLVVEDCVTGKGERVGTAHAKDWFLRRNTRFRQVPVEDKYLVGLTMEGWLERK